MAKRRKNKKPLLLNLVLMVVAMITVAGLAFASDGFVNWSPAHWTQLFTPASSSSSSSSQDTSEEPSSETALNILNHPTHPFNAIGDSVVLTLTITPSTADDQTIVWSSSDATKVSVTPLSATTARLTCNLNFTGTVTITATATQGTSWTGDDVSATCVCTYNHPVESIDLQLWNYGTTSSMHGGAVQVTNLVDLPISETTYYGLRVILTPAYPAISTYTMTNTNLAIEDFTTLSTFTNYVSGTAFKLESATIGSQKITITVNSDDGIHSDVLEFTIGNHLGVSGRAFSGSVTVYHSDGITVADTYASFSALQVAVNTSGKTWLAGSYIEINITEQNWVYPDYSIKLDTNYFEYDLSSSYSNLASPYVDEGFIYFESLNTAPASIFVKAKAATGGIKSVQIIPEYYNSLYIVNLPFVFTSPVTSLGLDQTTVEF